jgi:PAS domain S-box-containing protein
MGAGILQMTGYEHTEIDPDLWNSLVDEAFLLGDAASLAYDDAVQMARDGRLRVWECDYRIHTRTGDERWIYESALELPGQDGISRSSIGILQDITARKQVEEALRQSETKFRSIVEQLTEGFSLLDEEGRILEWNRAQENITGLKRDEVSGQYFWDVEQRVLLPEHHHARYVRQHRALVERGLKTGRSIFFQKPIEAIILNTRGQKIHVQQISFPMRTEKGFRIGSLLRDVTRQKEAEAQLLRWSEELEQRVNERTIQLETANKELEAFSYSISHDLRAPLRAIDGFTRILSEEINSFASMENKRHLRVIRDNAQQMGRLIDDLLAFSRLGRQQINKTPLDTNEIIQQSLVILSSDIEGRHIQFDIPDLPVSWGDATLLKQVWVNLLSNAIKFTRQCSPAKIQLGFEQRDVDTIFLIRDNGVGFDIRYADKLFGVFQRLHRPEEYEGTGVGLAIVQRIVRRHGGDIWADSDLGKGATFYFRLPAG